MAELGTNQRPIARITGKILIVVCAHCKTLAAWETVEASGQCPNVNCFSSEFLKV